MKTKTTKTTKTEGYEYTIGDQVIRRARKKCGTCGARTHVTAEHEAIDARHRAMAAEGQAALAKAQALADRTVDAYSAPRFAPGEWLTAAGMLLGRGFDERQAEAILKSKWTRWAGDEANHGHGEVTADDLRRFLTRMPEPKLTREVEALTKETFPDLYPVTRADGQRVYVTVPEDDDAAPAGEWVVMCRVSGGVTGTRTGTLKRLGEVQYFPDEATAQATADRLLREMNSAHATATYAYWPARAEGGAR